MSEPTPVVPQQPPEAAPQVSRWHYLRRVMPLLVLGLLLVLAWEELHSLEWHALRNALQHVSFAALLLLQCAGLLAVAGMLCYDAVLRRPLGVEMPLAQHLVLSWVANTFNNFIGLSGLTGSGIRFFALTRSGMSNGAAASYSLLLLLSVPTGLAVLALVALGSGGNVLDVIGVPHFVAQMVQAILAAYLPLFLLLSGNASLLRWLGSSTPPLAWGVRLRLVAISIFDWGLAMSVLALALWLVGASYSVEVMLTGFIAGGMAGILSLMPGGLGAFDAIFLLVLSRHGVASEQVAAALILYRLVYFVVPWLIGATLGVTVLAVGRESRFGQLLQRLRHSPLLRLPLALLSGLSVRLLSWLTLLAGLVLLTSAASPALHSRVTLLKQWAPLVAVESSHFLSVLVGVLLVALARGVLSRVKQAYRLTLLLLVSGALFSLLKGLDYEEASMMLIVAGLLYSQRKAFYRNSFSLLSRRNAFWLLALLLALTGYIVLGLMLYSDVPYRSGLWLHFAWHKVDAARFLRSLLALPLGLAMLLGWILFRLPRPPLQFPDEQALARAQALFDEYGGNSFAHLVYHGDKYLFFSSDGRALIQFGLIGDRAVALGDPCGAPQSLEGVILEFREFTDLYGLRPVFYEVSEERLSLYHDLGFSLFKLGESARIEVANFSLTGKKSESLRYSVNRARREGAAFAVLQPPLDEATWQRLAVISQTWLADKAGAEKGFSLGSFKRSYLERSAIAVVTINDEIVAFANLMPAYDNHATLSIDLMRYLPHRLPVGGVMDFLFVELIELARREGYRYFDLGIAPLSGVGESRYARAQERLAHLAFRYGNRFYNYKGLRGFKEKFHPQWRGVYLAYPFNMRAARLLVDIAALIAGGYRSILFKEQLPE